MKAILSNPQFIVRNGKPVAVVLPLKAYEEMLERLEDSEDVRWLRRAGQKPQNFRPLANYLAKHKVSCS